MEGQLTRRNGDGRCHVLIRESLIGMNEGSSRQGRHLGLGCHAASKGSRTKLQREQYNSLIAASTVTRGCVFNVVNVFPCVPVIWT